MGQGFVESDMGNGPVVIPQRFSLMSRELPTLVRQLLDKTGSAYSQQAQKFQFMNPQPATFNPYLMGPTFGAQQHVGLIKKRQDDGSSDSSAETAAVVDKRSSSQESDNNEEDNNETELDRRKYERISSSGDEASELADEDRQQSDSSWQTRKRDADLTNLKGEQSEDLNELLTKNIE